ncbi:MAG TPA: hypothetical protein VJ990_10100, partial [Clostridia bacterium]|nr:hypothetical protein [Clostridia bacterium]
MKKLLSVMLIFALLFSMAPVSMADSEFLQIDSEDKGSTKWENGNIDGYMAGEYVPFRLTHTGATTATGISYTIEHDMEDKDGRDYGFEEVMNYPSGQILTFYEIGSGGSNGAEIILTSPSVLVSKVEKDLTMVVEISNESDLIKLGEATNGFYMYWHAKLNENANMFGGGTGLLKVQYVNGGKITINFPVSGILSPDYGNIKVQKIFEGDYPELPESVWIGYGDSDPTEVTSDMEWMTYFNDLPEGSYSITETAMGNWTTVVSPSSVYVNPGEMSYVEVINTYNPSTGDVMFEKVWIDDPPEGLTTVSSVWTPYESQDGTTI